MELQKPSDSSSEYYSSCFPKRIGETTDIEKLKEERKRIQSYHTLAAEEKAQKIAIIDAQIHFLQKTNLMKIFRERIAGFLGKK